MDLKNTFIQVISLFSQSIYLFRIIYEKCYTMTKKNQEIILYVHIETFNYILMEILLFNYNWYASILN